jgi:hypothetical protein
LNRALHIDVPGIPERWVSERARERIQKARIRKILKEAQQEDLSKRRRSRLPVRR